MTLEFLLIPVLSSWGAKYDYAMIVQVSTLDVPHLLIIFDACILVNSVSRVDVFLKEADWKKVESPRFPFHHETV